LNINLIIYSFYWKKILFAPTAIKFPNISRFFQASGVVTLALKADFPGMVARSTRLETNRASELWIVDVG